MNLFHCATLSREELESFTPPYCPRPSCPWHLPGRFHKFKPYGFRRIQRYPYVNRRFQCANCGKVFSSSFFSLSYRDRTTDNYAAIYQYRRGSVSKREIAANLGVSLDTVLRRMKKISRQQLLRLARDVSKVSLTESIAYDGIENFSFSQYDPNNVNHAVGRESLFVYDFNFSPINRKGRMSRRQMARKAYLESIYGKYPSMIIEEDSLRVFQRLQAKAPKRLELHSDNHYLYRRALARMRGPNQINHIITPAKVARNYRNRLFAINHCDLLCRHRLSDFRRETIAFAKTCQAMMESFIFLAVDKNYCRPKFSKRQKIDKNANRESPAMHLGLTTKILNFTDFFKTRITRGQVELNADWRSFFEGIAPHSRRPICRYGGI